jgi:cyanophycinase
MGAALARISLGIVLAGTAACASSGGSPTDETRASAQTNRFARAPASAPSAVFFPRIGDPADDGHGSLGPGLAFMGGGLAPTSTFTWAHDVVTRGDLRVAGDVAILSTSGDDVYSDAIYAAALFNSVQTILVPEGASSADFVEVAHSLENIEIVVLVDQAPSSFARWAGTPLPAAVREVWARGGVLVASGGGARALGSAVLTAGDSVDSKTALADPYTPLLTLQPGVFDVPFLVGTVVELETHAADRFGRLAALSARTIADGFAGADRRVMGIGLDLGNAIAFDYEGRAGMLEDTGSTSRAWLLRGGPADRIAAGQPLEWRQSVATRFDDTGESLDVVHSCGTAFTYALAVDGAATPPFTPADPYEAQGTSSPCP